MLFYGNFSFLILFVLQDSLQWRPNFSWCQWTRQSWRMALPGLVMHFCWCSEHITLWTLATQQSWQQHWSSYRGKISLISPHSFQQEHQLMLYVLLLAWLVTLLSVQLVVLLQHPYWCLRFYDCKAQQAYNMCDRLTICDWLLLPPIFCICTACCAEPNQQWRDSTIKYFLLWKGKRVKQRLFSTSTQHWKYL